MRALKLLALGGLASLWAACGPSANASLSGKVEFADGSDASGLTVSLVGPAAKQMPSGSGGAYSFDKLVPGIYLVTVEAADTKEGRLSYAADVKGAIAAPALTFHAVGRLTGKVVDGTGVAVAGAQVALGGSDRAATTDDTGAYAFTDVPAGDYHLYARVVSPPQLADAAVTVKRGDNMGPTLMLADDTNAYGTLKGTLKSFVPGVVTGLHAIAGGISVSADVTGGWSLSLPPGNYEVVAGGGEYPDQSLGRFDVRSGEVTTVPPFEMSVYHPILNGSYIYAASVDAATDSFAAVRLSVNNDYSMQLSLVDLHSFNEKLVAVGPVDSVNFSPGGKWLTFRALNTQGTVAYNVASAQTWAMSVPGLQYGPIVSTDETVVFASSSNTLYRQDLSTGAVTTFTYPSGSGYFMSNDHFLMRSSNTVPFDLELVTPSGQPTTVFNQQTNWSLSLGYYPASGTVAYHVTWASQTCMTNCTVQLMTSAQTTPVTVTGNTLVGFPSPIGGSTRNWFGFETASTRILVKTADGTSTPLPTTTYQLIFNEDESRVAFYAGSGDVREDTVPPNANAAIAITGPGPYGAYLSPTRFMVFTNGASVKRADIRNGTPATDTDVDFQDAPLLFPPGASWVRKSTETRVGTVYDQGNDFTLAGIIGPTYLLGGSITSAGSVKDQALSGLGKYAVVSDRSNLYVLDGVKGEARLEVGEAYSGGGISPSPIDRYRVNLSTSYLYRSFDDTKSVSFSEPKVQLSTPPRYLPGGAVVAAAIDGNPLGLHDRWFIAVVP